MMFMYIIQRAASFGVGRKNQIFKLGELAGAWSDLIDESADKTPDVIQAFQKRVAARKMPDVRYKTVNLATQGWRGRQKTYYFARRLPAPPWLCTLALMEGICMYPGNSSCVQYGT